MLGTTEMLEYEYSLYSTTILLYVVLYSNHQLEVLVQINTEYVRTYCTRNSIRVQYSVEYLQVLYSRAVQYCTCTEKSRVSYVLYSASTVFFYK
jgi:hypothetical protein